MEEIGVEISGQRAKDLGLFDGKEMDYVIALETLRVSQPR
ncbi:MAG: hypothetical protein PHT97_09860 [Methanoculleus sp.]|nr:MULTISPECIES: hypothetical protein [unclassified Methanoculleus]MCK9319257.1 hypothetical protein [Methanoculleus sp.]MDD2254687.1 hypothetical protein [Methanoculleus sp.]MDD2787987.1 hypothetical protein [Methanoculleus sp.]MDD3217027.1 hypothetical protein [Methanoculleus sp.]MDD4315050.1 hypothetical protein [Methanoculleus sp.]